MQQPSTLRLIRNAAALAAASPPLLFSDWYNAEWLKRNGSDWLRCDLIPVAVKSALCPDTGVKASWRRLSCGRTSLPLPLSCDETAC